MGGGDTILLLYLQANWKLTGPFLTLHSSQAGENALEPSRHISDQVSINTQQLEAVTHVPPPPTRFNHLLGHRTPAQTEGCRSAPA